MISPATMTAAEYRAAWNPSEAEFQQQLVKSANELGWLTVHFRQMVGNPAGWPDLILIRGRTTIYAELKRRGGKVSPRQAEWIARLADVGADVRVWEPSQWDEIVAVLSGEAEGVAA